MGIFTYLREPDRQASSDTIDRDKDTVMVAVFRTNVNQIQDANALKTMLRHLVHPIQITFDLQDCDRILRVEAKAFDVYEIINTLNVCGFNCELLD